MRLAAGWRRALGAGLLFEADYLEAGRRHGLLGYDLRTHASSALGWTNEDPPEVLGGNLKPSGSARTV